MSQQAMYDPFKMFLNQNNNNTNIHITQQALRRTEPLTIEEYKYTWLSEVMTSSMVKFNS